MGFGAILREERRKFFGWGEVGSPRFSKKSIDRKWFFCLIMK
jgi:hypothetical protein